MLGLTRTAGNGSRRSQERGWSPLYLDVKKYINKPVKEVNEDSNTQIRAQRAYVINFTRAYCLFILVPGTPL